MAGYSGTPLAKKLGIADGMRVGVIGASRSAAVDGFATVPAVDGTAPTAALDVLIASVTLRSELASGIAAWGDAITPDGTVWVSWPKKAARKVVPSDVGEDDVRAVALPLGLVDVKVCAVDDVWSGLKLVWRKELRAARRALAAAASTTVPGAMPPVAAPARSSSAPSGRGQAKARTAKSRTSE